VPPAVPRRRGGVFVTAEGGFLTPRSRRVPRPLMSGSAKRARPRLIRVRLADNLRGAPGGPADPNGMSGSPASGALMAGYGEVRRRRGSGGRWEAFPASRPADVAGTPKSRRNWRCGGA
jgi:hypothetical protein